MLLSRSLKIGEALSSDSKRFLQSYLMGRKILICSVDLWLRRMEEPRWMLNLIWVSSMPVVQFQEHPIAD
jgi:hypothetical protein